VSVIVVLDGLDELDGLDGFPLSDWLARWLLGYISFCTQVRTWVLLLTTQANNQNKQKQTANENAETDTRSLSLRW